MSNSALRRPVVIALAGLPGAGKSTLAGALCDRFALSLLDRDALRDRMFPDCRYTDAEKRAAEGAVKAMIAENCAAARSSLIDGMTFGRQTLRDEFAGLSRACGARFLLIWLDCPADEARRRVASDRGHVAADRLPGLVDRVAEQFEAPGSEAWRIDGALPAATVVEQARRILITQTKLE